jgi:hypothetical protein
MGVGSAHRGLDGNARLALIIYHARLRPYLRCRQPHDQELIQPENHPPLVRVVWPAKTSIIPPARFPAAAAEAARLFASASTKLSQLKAQR